METSSDLTLLDVIKVILRNLVWIIISMIVFGALAFGYAKHKANSQPYVAKTSVVVYNPSKTKYDQYGVYNKEIGRMNTYKAISEDSVIMKDAQNIIDKKNGVKLSISEIKNAVSISNDDQTAVLKIEAKNTKKNDAKLIANGMASAIKNDLNSYINAGVVRKLGVANDSSVKKDGLSISKYLVVGLAFGLLFGLMVVLIKDIILKQFKERK
ncbi:hypothetical protein FC26_GL001457 [Paucilactobacillus vaccinostercus DSM 20634]|uniref:Polysaccharide chain length determinant N-terminal domain-containing protein n=1 Tax=Paucilactobacillus vaccinostercus DSM 20634 TaxID=1423813 RepID=A0A0R2A4H0_9LACO|nr:Wzz/FepE/Etk N-terminal domain-containing protein [Paucilactobacillus vaccinostercus]KRM61386.1 hypothetical protein FC26_GL001457 [Paucilactobacillus vaccinostercus DSM 20634]